MPHTDSTHLPGSLPLRGTFRQETVRRNYSDIKRSDMGHLNRKIPMFGQTLLGRAIGELAQRGNGKFRNSNGSTWSQSSWRTHWPSARTALSAKIWHSNDNVLWTIVSAFSNAAMDEHRFWETLFALFIILASLNFQTSSELSSSFKIQRFYNLLVLFCFCKVYKEWILLEQIFIVNFVGSPCRPWLLVFQPFRPPWIRRYADRIDL